MKAPQALFLDRDGTLIRWRHYLSDPAEVELIEGVSEALHLAKQAGCRLFLHTNQSGVGRGYFSMDAVHAVNRRMFELLGVEERFFDGICIAPDDPAQSAPDSYRKPSPRFELDMIRRHCLDPIRCYFVGDNECDLRTGLNSGMNSVWLERPVDGAATPEAVLAGKATRFRLLSEFVHSVFALEDPA